MMVPEADQVNTSICPGVSIRTYLEKEEWVFSFTLGVVGVVMPYKYFSSHQHGHRD